MTIGKILRNLREQTNKTQTDVSKDLKITPQAYSQYERDVRVPDALMLQKISKYYNVSIDYILDNTSSSSNTNRTYTATKSIDEELEELLDKLSDQKAGLMFKGQVLSDTTKEALLISLKNTLALADKMSEIDKKKNL